MASTIASRVFSSAHTAARPDADIVQPVPAPEVTTWSLVSGIESVAILPPKSSSAVVESPEWESVEPIIPNWNGLIPTAAPSASPRRRAERA